MCNRGLPGAQSANDVSRHADAPSPLRNQRQDHFNRRGIAEQRRIDEIFGEPVRSRTGSARGVRRGEQSARKCLLELPFQRSPRSGTTAGIAGSSLLEAGMNGWFSVSDICEHTSPPAGSAGSIPEMVIFATDSVA
jgi:hypothetical protein